MKDRPGLQVEVGARKNSRGQRDFDVMVGNATGQKIEGIVSDAMSICLRTCDGLQWMLRSKLTVMEIAL